MRKNHKRDFYRTNERIRAQELRLIDNEGKQIGVMSREDALTKAREEELDLVEIAPQAKPPVVKLIDFSKFLYQEKKRKKEEKKKQASSETKQLRFGPFIDEHDLEVKLKKARKFFEDGNKVKFIIRYKGRQMARQEVGYEVMKTVTEKLEGLAKIDREPKMEGRQLTMLMSKGK